MMKAETILEKVLAGTTEYRHRRNPKRQRIIHIEETWALMFRAPSSYGCGYGQNYCSGGVDLILIPGGKCESGSEIWDTARDRCGPVTPKRLARIIEVVKAELVDGVKDDRYGVGYRVRTALQAEFCKKLIKECAL